MIADRQKQVVPLDMNLYYAPQTKTSPASLLIQPKGQGQGQGTEKKIDKQQKIKYNKLKELVHDKM